MDHLEPTQLWTLVANIKQDISYGKGKLQTRSGTKHFSPGTKVYIIDCFAGMTEDITVIGLARDTKRLITIVIRAEWVEHLRVKLCYNPKVCSKIKAYFNKVEVGMQLYTEQFINKMFISISQWNNPESR
jgi:hypothetical protein